MKFGHRIRDAVEHVAHNVKDGIKDTFKAVGHGLEGAAHVLGSAARLDFKGVAAGASEMAHAVTEVAKNVVLLSPAGLAANTLMHDKLEKVLDKVEHVADKALDAAINSVAASADQLKGGLKATVHGVLTGNMKEAISGIAGAAMGGFSLLPSKLAFNAVAAGVGSVVSDPPILRKAVPETLPAGIGRSTGGFVSATDDTMKLFQEQQDKMRAKMQGPHGSVGPASSGDRELNGVGPNTSATLDDFTALQNKLKQESEMQRSMAEMASMQQQYAQKLAMFNAMQAMQGAPAPGVGQLSEMLKDFAEIQNKMHQAGEMMKALDAVQAHRGAMPELTAVQAHRGATPHLIGGMTEVHVPSAKPHLIGDMTVAHRPTLTAQTVVGSNTADTLKEFDQLRAKI